MKTGNSNLQYYYFGGHAMYAALQIFGIKEGDEVLTPAWDCDSALRAFRKVECKLKFYKTIPQTFHVDLKNLESQITSKTKLIHIINHFGFPQPWEEIIKLREKYGIPILEDNAYSFDTFYDGKKLGDFGDIAFFSFRKLLPITSGAVLKINNLTFNPRLNKKFYYKEELVLLPYFILDIFNYRGSNILKRIWRSVKKKPQPKEFWYPLYSETLAKLPPGERDTLDKDFYSNPIKPLSQLGFFILKFYQKNYRRKTSFEKRNNYLKLANELADIKGITIIHPKIEDSTIPHVFSILIAGNRDFIFDVLDKEGFPVWIWPSLSQEVLNQLGEFPDVVELGQNLLQIKLSGTKKLNYKILTKRIIELTAE